MAQTAMVKEASVKEGSNAKGVWTNTLITTMDGAKLGTFEKAASGLKPGDRFEFEPEIKGDKVNIKRGTFKILSAATPAQVPHQNANDPGGFKRDTVGIQFEYNLKAQLQHEERVSIEAQTAYIKIMEMAGSGMADLGHATFADLFNKALRWADQRLDAAMANGHSAPHSSPSNRPSEAPGPAGGPAPAPEAQHAAAASDMPASGAELLTRATRELGYHGRSDVFAVLKVDSIIEVKDLAAAWAQLKAAKP